MSGKSEKKLRKLVREEYENKVMEHDYIKQNEIVTNWLCNLMKAKFSKRWKVAKKIILGSKYYEKKNKTKGSK